MATWYWAYSIAWPDYAYMGLPSPAGATTLSVGVAIPLALVPVGFLPRDCARPSALALWFLYLTVLAPFILMSAFVPGPLFRGYHGFVLWTIAAMLLLAMAERVPRLALRHYGIRWADLTFIVALGCVLVLVVLIYTTGISFSFLDLQNVYQTRSRFSQATLGYRYIDYFVTWAAYVLCPLLICSGLAMRSISTAAGSIAIEWLLYFTSGNKSFFFAPIVIIGVWLTFTGDPRGTKVTRRIVWVLSGSFAVCAALRAFLSSGSLNYYIFQRVGMIPALLTGDYYEFFSRNPHVWWADGILRRFLTSPYSENVPHVIGLRFFQSTATNANANFWADGYANGGLWGVLIEAIVLAAVLWFVDSAAERLRNPSFVAAASVMTVVYLCNAGVQTTLATGGLMLIPVLFLLIGGVPSAAETRRSRYARLRRKNTGRSSQLRWTQ